MRSGVLLLVVTLLLSSANLWGQDWNAMVGATLNMEAEQKEQGERLESWCAGCAVGIATLVFLAAAGVVRRRGL